MNFVEIVKAIAEVGVLVVIAAIFLFIAYRTFSRHESWLEEFIKSSNKSHHPSSDAAAVLDVINSKIYQEMRGVLNALQSDRSYVFLYHNGGASTSGLYFQKMSCICEVVSQGILPVVSNCQNLHRSSYSLLCDQLKTKHSVSISNPQDLRGEDNFLYQELVARHSLASYFRALTDVNGHVIGFIGIDYCSLNDSVTEDQITKLLKTVGLKISSLVDIRDEVK